MATYVRRFPVINGLNRMNKFKVKLEVFDKDLQNYEELYDFFSSHQFTHFSKTKFIGYMKCLFNDNPFGKGLQVVARDVTGKMIGHNSIISVPFIYDGVSISGGQNINLLVHSNFRKKNLFLEMAAKLFESAEKHNINFIYGFPNPAAVPGHKKTQGWNFINPSYWETKISETSEFDIINKYIPIKNLKDITLQDISNTENNNLFQIHKTIEYLNWRFITLGNFFKYDIYKILDDSENFLGIVVLKEYKKNQITYGQIIDTTIPINNLLIFDDLLNFYFDYYKEKKTLNLQFLLFSPRIIRDYLTSRGFSPDTKNRFFIYRSNNQKYLDAIKSDRFLLYLSSKDNL